MTKGCIYYTDCRVTDPIFSTCQRYIAESGLPITTVSLCELPFGDKRIHVRNRVRSYPTFVFQILTALGNATEDYVFFCEHDVLYSKSHFEFTPPRDDVFYYNNNVWRWKLWDFKLITYDDMRPLSCLCVNRKFAFEHYLKRWEAVYALGLDQFRSREPRMGRIWGYEPGTKKRRRGGFSDDVCELWNSRDPNIDIRHNRTFTSIKCDLKDFKNEPKNWREVSWDKVPYWDLKKVFPEGMKNHCSDDIMMKTDI